MSQTPHGASQRDHGVGFLKLVVAGAAIRSRQVVANPSLLRMTVMGSLLVVTMGCAGQIECTRLVSTDAILVSGDENGRSSPCNCAALSFAGIRRLFASHNHPDNAPPWLRSALCRTAEKKLHLERRRGGGTTARAGC